jgi:hypothetical protein
MDELYDFSWLCKRERGEDISHVPEATRTKYRQLEQLLAALPDPAPDPGWKHRVLAALATPPSAAPLAASGSRPGPRGSAQRLNQPVPVQPPLVALPQLASPRILPPPATGATTTAATAARGRTRLRQTWVIAGVAASALGTALYLRPPASAPREVPAIRARLAGPGRLVAGEAAITPAPPTAAAAGVAGGPIHTAPPDDPVRIAWSDDSAPASVVATIRRGTALHRSAGVSIGDILVVDIQASRPFELRMYGDAGEPLARCGRAQPCVAAAGPSGDRFHFEYVLRAPGDVRTILFTGDPIPEAFGGLDADLRAAQRAQVQVQQISFVYVL